MKLTEIKLIDRSNYAPKVLSVVHEQTVKVIGWAFVLFILAAFGLGQLSSLLALLFVIWGIGGCLMLPETITERTSWTLGEAFKHGPLLVAFLFLARRTADRVQRKQIQE